MFQTLNCRSGHYALLLVIAAVLYLPALGAPSLWDIDEGNNAEAAREMFEAGNWIVPTFNAQLRVDKPVLLYWFQMIGYQLFGVGEWAARLPSALAALLTVLLVYELGRSLFDAGTGLLAGLVLASSLLFCGSAHFANPDALLVACTVATFFLFWHGYRRQNPNWLMWIGVSTGIGFLAKGPVAVVLPTGVIVLFLLWTRQVRRLLDRRIVLGWLAWGLVAVPWFALVGSETKGEFLKGFFLRHNRDRFLSSLEGHGGPIFYHVASLLLGFLPWAAFLGPVCYFVWQQFRVQSSKFKVQENSDPRALNSEPGTLNSEPGTLDQLKFLLCWIGVIFVFFTVSRTKLPNYILPLYPAVALLTAHFLEQWRRGAVQLPRWALLGSLASWALAGVGVSVGLLIAGGVIELSVLRGRYCPGLERHAFLGVIPLIGAGAAWLCWRRDARTGLLGSLVTTAVLLAAGLGVCIGPALDAYKAPRPLVETAEVRQLDHDIQVGSYAWFQPSLVFYCRRDVRQLPDESQVVEFLRSPLPVYLFVPAATWQQIEPKVASPHRLLSQHPCLYTHRDVVVVTNR